MSNTFLSFSKRLSRRILTVNVVTITVLALLVISFAIARFVKMTNAYFRSELKAANESVARIIDETDQDGFYQYMRRIDADINKNPLWGNPNDKNMWAYCVVIDSAGNFLYHPDKQRIGKDNFFDNIQQPSDEFRKKFTPQSRGQVLGSGEAQAPPRLSRHRQLQGECAGGGVGDKGNAALLVINPTTEFDISRNWSITLSGSFFARRTHYAYYDDVKCNTFELKLGVTVHL